LEKRHKLVDIESGYSNEGEAVMHVSNVVTDLIKTESILRAAPSAIILQYIIFGMLTTTLADSTKAILSVVAWFIFFIHSVAWKFVIRRIMERGIMSKRTIKREHKYSVRVVL